MERREKKKMACTECRKRKEKVCTPHTVTRPVVERYPSVLPWTGWTIVTAAKNTNAYAFTPRSAPNPHKSPRLASLRVPRLRLRRMIGSPPSQHEPGLTLRVGPAHRPQSATTAHRARSQGTGASRTCRLGIYQFC